MLSNNKLLLSRLEHSLAKIIEGMSLEKWAEHSTTALLKTTGVNGPPVNLRGNLLKARRIEKIDWHLGEIPERGQLEIGDNGFIIKTTNKYYAFWARFIVAHEIAHTFFYDLKKWPPKQLTHIEPGNRDVELLWGAFPIFCKLFGSVEKQRHR